jgi:septal ring factor EnvC (AmiA/AmiB activator)
MPVALMTSVLLLVGASSPSWAQDAGAMRDATRTKRQQVQDKLDAARASDAQVEAELGRLDASVATQQARLSDSRQAEQAALAQAKDATRRLEPGRKAPRLRPLVVDGSGRRVGREQDACQECDPGGQTEPGWLS